MAFTNEVLVLTTATRIPRQTSVTRALEIFNNGPNTIWVCVNGQPVENKCRPVLAGASYAMDLPSDVPVFALASTANQVTGAATIVTEVP